MVRMISVAASQGVKIHCPTDGMYSFFNSPYPSHLLSMGLDVYPNRDFMDLVQSPVCGKVIQLRKVKAPKGRGFQDAGYDVVFLLRSNENPDTVIKLLHVDPCVKIGDDIKVGDDIGSLLRSGYFGFGTSPHIHVEIRRPEDPLRVRGGYKIKRIQTLKYFKLEEEIKGIVIDSRDEFTLLQLVSKNGLTAEIGGKPCLLDGGVPYYGWMGAHFDKEPPLSSYIKLVGIPIGIIDFLGSNICQAKCLDVGFDVNGFSFKGLSLGLSPVGPAIIKLIPFKLGTLRMYYGEEAIIDVFTQ